MPDGHAPACHPHNCNLARRRGPALRAGRLLGLGHTRRDRARRLSGVGGQRRTRLAAGRRAHSVPVPEAKLQHTVLLRERRLRGGRVPEFHRDAL